LADDLVRVGNFTEQIDGVADIAFFHHRTTLSELYDAEATHGRQRLVRECCGARAAPRLPTTLIAPLTTLSTPSPS
jgi:hypothetical protein